MNSGRSISRSVLVKVDRLYVSSLGLVDERMHRRGLPYKILGIILDTPQALVL